ncbi:MAG: PilW family protein [Pseudomonadota bacterium]
MRRGSPRLPQRGSTLVELLVALAIGLVLSGALVITWLGNLQTNQSTMALAQLHEDGQAALGMIAQQLRQAGYNPAAPGADAPRDLKLDGITLFACDSGFESITQPMPSLTCASAKPGPAAIAVAYLADRFNTVPTADTPPRATDCLGAGIAALADDNGPYFVAQNRFFVANGNLMCAGSGGSKPFANPQPFVENVEDLRLTFGVSSPHATGTVPAGYLSASELGPLSGHDGVIADAGFMALTPAQRWDKVVSVRVCLVMRSAGVVLEGRRASQVYTGCGGMLQEATDGRMRRAFSTTVLLRNRMSGS